MLNNIEFEPILFLTSSIRPFFEQKFKHILTCPKNEQTISCFENDSIKISSNIKNFFSAQLEFIAKTATIDCSSDIASIIGDHFILEIKSVPKKEVLIEIKENNNESSEEQVIETTSFKEFTSNYLPRIAVYKHQILFRLLVLYFRMKEPVEVKSDPKDNKKNKKFQILRKEFTKDIIKLIDLLRIKLDSNEGESFEDFFKAIAFEFSLGASAQFLEWLKEIFEKCEINDSELETLEAKLNEINNKNQASHVDTAENILNIENIPPPQEVKKSFSCVVPTKSIVEEVKLEHQEKSLPSEVASSKLNNALLNLKEEREKVRRQSTGFSTLSFPLFKSEKSQSSTTNDRRNDTPLPSKPTLFSSQHSQQSQHSHSSQLSQSNFIWKPKFQETVKASEAIDSPLVSLVEKSKLLNQRAQQRSCYSSFAKTTRVVEKKKHKNKETYRDRFPENEGIQMKKTKLTPDNPFHDNSFSFDNRTLSQGIKVENMNMSFSRSVHQQQQQENKLQVPVLPQLVQEWGFGDDILAINTPIKEGLSEASMTFSSSNSKRLLEY